MQPIQQHNYFDPSQRHFENFEPSLPLFIVVGLTVLGVLANVNVDDRQGLRFRARVENTTGVLIVCAIATLFWNAISNLK